MPCESTPKACPRAPRGNPAGSIELSLLRFNIGHVLMVAPEHDAQNCESLHVEVVCRLAVLLGGHLSWGAGTGRGAHTVTECLEGPRVGAAKPRIGGLVEVAAALQQPPLVGRA